MLRTSLRLFSFLALLATATACSGGDDDGGSPVADATPGTAADADVSETVCGEGIHAQRCTRATQVCRLVGATATCQALPAGCADDRTCAACDVCEDGSTCAEGESDNVLTCT